VSDIEERIVAVLRRLDDETTGGDLASRSATSLEQWAAVLVKELGLHQQRLTVFGGTHTFYATHSVFTAEGQGS
jgi:hypothetical protein